MNTLRTPTRSGSTLALPHTPERQFSPPTVTALTWQGLTLVAVCLAGFFGWAAETELSSAVLANATIALQSRRQEVQHLEGGIIAQVSVREGATVAAGDLLYKLDATQAHASAAILQGQRDAALALEARLLAERDGTETIDFPAPLTARAGDARVSALMRDQEVQFRDRRAAYLGQVAVLQSEGAQLRGEIEALRREERSGTEQRALIDRELVGVTELVKKGLVTLQRQLALERERARLDGSIGRSQGDQTKAQTSIDGTRLQIAQIGQKRQEEIASNLQDIRAKIADQTDRLTAALDILNRLEIRAPCAGVVQNVRIGTVGAVVRPGDLLLEIVPSGDELLIEAEVRPNDIDRLYPGMQSEIRFPAFRERETPVIQGKVRALSRDRLADEATHAPYYLAVVAISDTDIPPLLAARLRAGMPAEVIFPTGDRTVLGYLLKPMSDAVITAFREP